MHFLQLGRLNFAKLLKGFCAVGFFSKRCVVGMLDFRVEERHYHSEDLWALQGEKKKVGFGSGECLSQAISFEFCESFWCGDSVMILIDTFSSSFMFRKIG